MRGRGPRIGGSSPLTRGKRPSGCPWPCLRGLIPAHAGKTLRRGSRRRCRGLIPAHAGKTFPPCGGRVMTEAHPRSRGENWATPKLTVGQAGSSPLTRGKHGRELGVGRGRGLIPAHAGKTRLEPRRGRARGAHPRSRGENRAFDVLAVGRMGSSPLTRGKPTGRRESSCTRGLIPAHAGKTANVRGVERRARAHPRSRGENTYSNVEQDWISGSSPLTRGKQFAASRAVLDTRLIPAHAGKTLT